MKEYLRNVRAVHSHRRVPDDQIFMLWRGYVAQHGIRRTIPFYLFRKAIHHATL